MKILKIEFKNINSLQGEHVIDFCEEPFDGNNLFAITGPTGAGKSTILDVITLALFNEIPRLEKISKNEIEKKGAILTRGQKEAYARVTYILENGRKFISEWRISTNSNGNLRDYDMNLAEAETGQILAEKKSEIPGKNEALIGLKYNQFKKSVILAQGAFAEFLKVSKKDRAELLEKITGTEIYRHLGMKAYERFSVYKNKIADQKKTIETFEQELLDDAKMTEITQKKEDIEKRILTTEAGIKAAEEKIKLKINIGHQQSEIQKLNNAQAENELKIRYFNQHQGLLLAKHHLVEPWEEDLKNWDRLQKVLLEEKNKLSENNRMQATTANEKRKFLDETKGLLQTEIDETHLLNHLAEFEREVISLKNQLKDKSEKGIALKNEINADLRPLEISLDTAEIKTRLEKRQQTAIEFIEKSKSGRLEIPKINEEIKRLQQKRDELHAAKSAALELNTAEKFLLGKEKELLEIKNDLQPLPGRIKELNAALQELLKDVRILELRKENSVLYSSMSEKRSQLKDGEPCPLCGALHHPLRPEFEHKIPEIDAELQEVKEKERKTHEQLTTNTSRLDSLTERETKLQSEIQNDKTSLELKRSEFSKNFTFRQGEDWEKLIQENTDLSLHLEQLLIKLKEQEITGIVIPKLKKIEKIREEARELKMVLNVKYPHDTAVEERIRQLEERWNHLLTEERIQKSQQDDIQKNINKYQSVLTPLHTHLLGIITKINFPEIADAFSALLTFESKSALEKEQNELNRKAEQIKTNQKTYKKILNELLVSNDDKTLETIENEKNELEIKLVESRDNLENNNRLIANQKANKLKIQDLKDKIGALQSQGRYWEILDKMIGDKTGSKFNQIAQDLTLIQLIQLANLRLAQLSRRYLIDNPAWGEDDSLVVIDKDMGSQRRSVKTLSGGETFVISLALALALSDLASSNVQINSLFIDEGFGTLDPETLDQVLTTLEQLQEEGSKMIGIISHVDALKERLGTQIQLIPNGRGFSRMILTG